MKILFVCLGNICRSPLAEAIFNHKIKKRGLENGFQGDSCGTADYHIGDPPDPRTIKNAAKNGIVMRHLGRQLEASDLEHFDMILPMDQSNLDHILLLKDASDHAGKIRLMREFDTVGRGADVPDPYHAGEREFQEVFEILDRSVEGLVSYLIQAP